LPDELASWRQAGIHSVLSLLTSSEENDLDLGGEASQAKRSGMEFLSLPIADRQVPNSESELTAMLETIEVRLASGKNVVIHCRQGVGRSGLVAACLLVSKGLSSGAAIETVQGARGVPIPETVEQRNWIDRYAAMMAAPK
jgi:protein-tyrosine phosphatase